MKSAKGSRITARDLQALLLALGYAIIIIGRVNGPTRVRPCSRRLPTRPVLEPGRPSSRLTRGWEIEPAVSWAVRETEAPGQPFVDGRPTLLCEPHRVARSTAGRFDAVVPVASDRRWGQPACPATQASRCERLLRAVGRDLDVALASADDDAVQILGKEVRLCTARDPLDLALVVARGEPAQRAGC